MSRSFNPKFFRSTRRLPSKRSTRLNNDEYQIFYPNSNSNICYLHNKTCILICKSIYNPQTNKTSYQVLNKILPLSYFIKIYIH